MTNLPIATYLLIAFTVVVSAAGFNNRALLERFAFEIGPILRRKQVERLLTASFLHVDGGHLLVNMLTLFFFGPVLEARYGPVSFVALYLFCSIFTGVVVLFLRRNQLQYKAVGASDAVSGVLGAYCVLYPFSKVYLFFIPVGIPAILYAVLYLAWSAWAARRQIGNVAHDAHIAGLLAGAGVILLANPDILTGG
ncbi:MAG: rhomboid family intramembrane serine protease [Roseibium sp.]|uniref:rhomboid family intramembrane serine protease n=1 Tax=Roseibium sp. TaxID=1936156 RepID=UPI002639B5E9|nr:rhomboid family intramembrane serine protease [Roseibium sp.]MCV0426557.1 rhomboid family intramembrane serine protease [Roseibium sp.]